MQNGANGAGTAIVQAPCTSAPAMYWSIVQIGSNYQIVSQSSGLCLNIYGASTQAGAQLIEWPCQGAGGGNNDKWTVTTPEDGQGDYFNLVSASSGMCANVYGASLSPGANIVQWPCQGASGLNDQFYISPAATPAQTTAATTVGSEIYTAGSGQCIEAANGSTSWGANIVQGVCSGAAAEAWSLVAVGQYYHIVSQDSGLCLNVSGNSTNAGGALIQWGCQDSNSYNDQWNLVPISSSAGNYYHLAVRSTGMCANIGGASQNVGAQLIQWYCQFPDSLNDQFLVGAAASAQATLPSAWTAVIPLPVNAIATANLPNGNLLLWSANAQFSFEGDVGNASAAAYSATFNPATGIASQATNNSAGADLFCPGTSVLANGNVLVNGGSSSPKTTIYNPSTGQWQADANMNLPRGYESTTMLSNGSVYTMGGSWSGAQSSKDGEVWTSGQGWLVLTGAPDDDAIGPDPQGIYRGDNHMWLFAQSNGMVFQAGPSAQMNWINTTGAGSISSAGNRGTDAYSINGNAVLYDVGKILKVGGAQSYQQNGNTATYASNSAYTIDISAGPGAKPVVNQLNPMSYGRAFANSVVLPSGDVVVVGGQSIPNPFTDTGAVLVPELWNHTSQSFTPLSPMQTPRTYHSTALLLQDGRVFVGGGGQCGSGCPENHLNAEILTPPYLLNADGSAAARPTIQSAPSTASRGGAMTVATNTVVSSFALMRLSSTTHTVNNDQRRIPLAAVPQSGMSNSYQLTIPSDPGVVLPGYYMLFALNAKGVPSVAVTVQIP